MFVSQSARILCLLAAVLLGLRAGELHAQSSTSPQVEARRNFTFASEDLMLPSFAPESEADSDLGVQLLLQPRGSYDPFTVNAYTGYSFTTNATLAETDARSDHIWAGSASVSFLPVLRGNLFGEISARQTSYRYEQETDFDFDSFEAGTGLIYVIRSLGDLSTFVRYNFTDLTGGDGIVSSFYQNHAVETGAFLSQIITRNQSLYLAYRSEISLDGDPGFAKRDEHGLTAGYRLTPMPKVKLDLFSRISYLDYEELDRDDRNFSSGVSLSYNFTPHLYLSGYASWVSNESDLEGVGDYETWITGIRFGGNWKF